MAFKMTAKEGEGEGEGEKEREGRSESGENWRTTEKDVASLDLSRPGTIGTIRYSDVVTTSSAVSTSLYRINVRPFLPTFRDV